jgi:hypothetical protein
MYDEKEHAHEGHKMSIMAKVAWAIVGIYAFMILLAWAAPPPSAIEARQDQPRRYVQPMWCVPQDDKLLCDPPAYVDPSAVQTAP